jgi:MFS family permease
MMAKHDEKGGQKSVQNERDFSYASLTRGVGKFSPFSAFLIFFFPALGGLLFGYDIGATSAVLIQLKSSTYSGVLWSHDVAESSFLQGAITSMVTLGALIGSMICFQVADNLGRKRTLLLASSLYFFGALLEVISGIPSWEANSGVTVLIVGRLFYGFGCGFAMHSAPTYIGEMAPSEIRGIESSCEVHTAFFVNIYQESFQKRTILSLVLMFFMNASNNYFYAIDYAGSFILNSMIRLR